MVHQFGAALGVILAAIIAAGQAHSAFTVTGAITDSVNSFAVLVVLKAIELGLLWHVSRIPGVESKLNHAAMAL